MKEQELEGKTKPIEDGAVAVTKADIPPNTKVIIGVLVLVLIATIGYASYLHFKLELIKPAEIAKPLIVQPQVIHTNTETIREVSVQAAPKGNIFQFTEREGKQFVTIESKEYLLASKTKPAEIKIGENGQIVMATESTTKLDVTDMVRAQVNEKLAIQAAQIKVDSDKKVASIRRQRTIGYVVGGLAVGALVYTVVKK